MFSTRSLVIWNLLSGSVYIGLHSNSLWLGLGVAALGTALALAIGE